MRSEWDEVFVDKSTDLTSGKSEEVQRELQRQQQISLIWAAYLEDRQMDVFLLSMQPVQGFSDKEKTHTQGVNSKHIVGYRV